MLSQQTEQAARQFFAKLVPSEQWDGTDHPSKALILAAFDLYAREWGRFDIREWKWPFRILDDGESFVGDQPWTILLARATEIARERSHA